jgi:GNAT superfamily N-acetyltransferase
MPDMLVKLYELPDLEPILAEQRAAGVDIRRAIAPEKHVVVEWAREHFSETWASECDVAFTNHPVSCYIAVENEQLLGFGCYEATCKDFFGPTGVLESTRGRGIGKALLIVCLHALREMGYGYAVIGGAGPTQFYEKTVGAVIIPDSTPGVYRGLLKR